MHTERIKSSCDLCTRENTYRIGSICTFVEYFSLRMYIYILYTFVHIYDQNFSGSRSP